MVTPRDKLEDFKHSGLSVVKPPLGMSFAPFATGIPADPTELEKLIQDAPGILSRAKENEQLMSDGSVEGLTARTGQFSEHQKKLLERLKSQGRANDGFNILLLDALENSNLPAFVAAQVFDGMSDEEIDACVAEIELETGKPFEEYARDILGEDMPPREPGQSDAEYHRTVLKKLGEEMLEKDPKTGEPRVKAKYEDDPTAQIIKRNETFKKTVETTAELDAQIKADGGLTAETESEITETAAKSYSSSDAMDQTTKTEEVEDISRVEGEKSVDRDTVQQTAKNENTANALAGIFGGAADGSTPEIKEASVDETINPTTPTGSVVKPV